MNFDDINFPGSILANQDDVVVDEILKLLNGHRAERILAGVFERLKLSSYYLELTVDTYWTRYCRKYVIPAVNQIYYKLVSEGMDASNKLNYNDGDDNLWFLPTDSKQVFCHTSQNMNLLFILDDDGNFNIRRYYDEYVLPKDIDDKFDKEDAECNEEECANGGVSWAIKNAENLSENWSDEILKNPYPKRPSLRHYQENGFECRYNDFRDAGYVASSFAFNHKMEGSMIRHGMYKIVFDCYLPCMLRELFPEEKKFETWEFLKDIYHE